MHKWFLSTSRTHPGKKAVVALGRDGCYFSAMEQVWGITEEQRDVSAPCSAMRRELGSQRDATHPRPQ